ncbi:MAG TPA: hypothetical protein VI854_02235, partial [Acidimicrobiia bacterium]|nr:hypothetical protein [Acidimicrobiia bacterium]
MSAFGRFGLLPLAAALAGLGLSLPAGAQTVPETAGDVCDGVFDGPIASAFTLATDPPPRSDARPGQDIHLTGNWPVTEWESVTSLVSCIEIAKHVDPSFTAADEPPANDGTFSRTFQVPEDLFNGTVICTRMRLAGDPTGEATEAVWIGKQ